MSVHRIAAFRLLLLALFALIPVRAGAFQTTSVTLEWTAPGDDNATGIARTYDIRYSRNPITASNFALATKINSLLLPAPAGVKQQFTIFGLTPGVLYYFAIRASDEAGNWSSISNIAKFPNGTVDSGDPVPVEVHFSTPWPNPATSLARFTLSLPQDQWVRIEAFDVTGRRVRTLALGMYSGGTFDLSWNLRDDAGQMLNAGTYLVRGQVGDSVFLRRITVVR